MPPSQRFWWIAGVVGVLIVLALFGARGRSPERRDASASVATEAARPEAPTDPSSDPSSDVAPASFEPGNGPPKPAASPAAELPPQVRRFLEANVYPPTSRPLTRGSTDLLRPNRRYEKPRPLDEDGDLTFVFTADRYYYTGDEIALVWLEVSKGDQPAAVRILRAAALAETDGAPGGTPVDLGLRPDGVRWSGGLDLGKAFPGHHGTILLEVAFQAEDGDVHDEAIRIFSTPVDRVPARVTGEFRDSVTDGSLLVEVGVDVFEPGFFRFDANLYDGNGEPVAFSVFKGDLGAGEQWIPLEFFGKILRDQGIPGPYTIEQIRGYRFLDGQTPDRELLVEDPVTHTTLSYDVGLFSDAEYESEHKERMVQLMLEDLDAGRSLDLPTVAGKPR